MPKHLAMFFSKGIGVRCAGLLVLALFAELVFAAEGLNIAEGERFEYPERNFSVVPPTGFEVQDSAGGIFLNMREQHRRGLAYRRNIQVFWSKGYRYIDDAAAKELAGDIGPKFSKYSPTIKNYQVSRHAIVDIGERKAILFYNSYTIDKTEMAHIVMLISGDKEHYLVTFTDLLKNYEKNESDDTYNNLWWDCFTSITVAGSPPYRYRHYVLGGGVLAIFLLLVLPILLFRKYSSGRYYDSFAHESTGQQEAGEAGDDYGDDYDGDDSDDDDDDDGDDDIVFEEDDVV